VHRAGAAPLRGVYCGVHISCAPRGSLASPAGMFKERHIGAVSMVYSLSKFAALNPSVDVNTGIVFGHSYSGVFGSSALFDKDCRQRQGFQDFFCGGATTRKPLPLNIKVWAMFEGGADQPHMIPHNMLVVYTYSPFSEVASTALPGGFRGRLRNLTVGGRGNLVEVSYTNVTNHRGPNEFEPKFLHAKTLCSATRPPAEQSFNTTRQTQSDVNRSIADVTSMSFYCFNARGAKSLPELLKKTLTLPFVLTADTLADLDNTSGKVLKQ